MIALADQAQQRLCRRFTALLFHHKPAPKVVVAVARELAGFLWATGLAGLCACALRAAVSAVKVMKRNMEAGDGIQGE